MIRFNKIGFTFVKQSPAWHTLAQIVLQHHGQQSKAFLASFLNLRECYHLNHTDGRQRSSAMVQGFPELHLDASLC